MYAPFKTLKTIIGVIWSVEEWSTGFRARIADFATWIADFGLWIAGLVVHGPKSVVHVWTTRFWTPLLCKLYFNALKPRNKMRNDKSDVLESV